MDIINVYCVFVKPGYSIAWVERLYFLCRQYLSYDFTFNCLTDQDNTSALPINFIRVEKYELDIWWNKILLFKEDISKDGINLYFDLDIKFKSNIDFLISDIQSDKLCVVDTPWKKDYFDENGIAIKKKLENFNHKNYKAFYCYGNSSVMGWIGQSQKHIYENFDENLFEILKENFGDDTYINNFADKKYFKENSIGYDKSNCPITIYYKECD
jgi:hypothetical protein